MSWALFDRHGWEPELKCGKPYFYSKVRRLATKRQKDLTQEVQLEELGKDLPISVEELSFLPTCRLCQMRSAKAAGQLLRTGDIGPVLKPGLGGRDWHREVGQQAGSRACGEGRGTEPKGECILGEPSPGPLATTAPTHCQATKDMTDASTSVSSSTSSSWSSLRRPWPAQTASSGWLGAERLMSQQPEHQAAANQGSGEAGQAPHPQQPGPEASGQAGLRAQGARR